MTPAGTRCLLVCALLPFACGQRQPAPSPPSLEGGSASEITLHLNGTRAPDALLEATIKDGKSQVFTPDGEVEIYIGAEKTCRSVSNVLDKRSYDATSHRLKAKLPLDGTCDFLGHKEPVAVELHVKDMSGHGFETTTSIVLSVDDDRGALLPELDAELAKLDASVAAIGDPAALPPCTAELVKDVPKNVETLDTRGWTWLQTTLFNDIASYRARDRNTPDATLRKLSATSIVLVYTSTQHSSPSRKGDQFTPGVFVGHAVILDRTAGKARCAMPLEARSSSDIRYTAKTSEHGIQSDDAQEKLDHDFRESFALALRAQLAAVGL